MRSGRLRHLLTFYRNIELVPDYIIDKESAWDFQFTGIDPTWTFDNSSLLWTGKIGDIMMIKNLVLEHGVDYTFIINMTNYSSTLDGFGVPAVTPRMYVSLGYNTGYTGYPLDTSQSAQSITGVQTCDDSGRESDSISDGISYQSVFFYGNSSLISGGTPTWRVQSFSIKKTNDIATAYASIEPISSRDRLTRHQYYGESTHIVLMRYDSSLAGIDNSWRISYDGRIFIITGVIDINEHNRTIKLMCSEGLREKNEPTV